MQKYKQVNVSHPEDVGVPRKIISDPPSEKDPSPAFRGSVWPIVIIVLIILALAVCFLPWPTHIQLSISGVELAADGTILETGEIVIDAWMYNYLFRPDEFYVNKLQLPNHEVGSIIKSVRTHLIHYEMFDFYSASFASWSSEGYSEWPNHGEMYFTSDQLNWVIELSDRVFVGSTLENADYAEIRNQTLIWR